MEETTETAVVKDALSKDKHEVIIRTGDAAVIEPKIKRIDVKLTGTIESPAEYFTKRKDQFKPERAHVVFSKDPEKLNIVLTTNEHMERPKYIITGKLEQSDEMKMFGIMFKSGQNPKQYSVRDLSQLLRFNKVLFSAADECQKVIEGLQKFSATVNAKITEEETQRGSKSGSYEIKVDSSIPMKFNLSMPLFKGKALRKFTVDICFEVKGTKDIVLWLESPELAKYVTEDAQKFMDEQLKKLSSLVQIEI